MTRARGLAFASGITVFALACAGQRIVGDEKSTDGAGTGGSDNTGPSFGTSGSCRGADDAMHRPYEDWLRDPNAFAGLEGTWGGQLADGTDVTLALGPAQGSIRFGNDPTLAAPTDADAPHACASSDEMARAECKPKRGFSSGFRFSIHGAENEAEQLAFTIYQNQPWDTWCTLRLPVLDVRSTDCVYLPMPNLTSSIIDGVCRIGDEIYDCQVFDLLQTETCRCGSDTCFMNTAADTVDMVFRVLDSGARLAGTIDQAGFVELVKE